MCSLDALTSFLREFMRQQTISKARAHCELSGGSGVQHELSAITYEDFLALVSPRNRDFTELMMQRQADFDIQTHENAYISTMLDQTIDGTKCRLARPIFVETEIHSSVAGVLA